jgi:hypothetical protein
VVEVYDPKLVVQIAETRNALKALLMEALNR